MLSARFTIYLSLILNHGKTYAAPRILNGKSYLLIKLPIVVVYHFRSMKDILISFLKRIINNIYVPTVIQYLTL